MGNPETLDNTKSATMRRDDALARPVAGQFGAVYGGRQPAAEGDMADAVDAVVPLMPFLPEPPEDLFGDAFAGEAPPTQPHDVATSGLHGAPDFLSSFGQRLNVAIVGASGGIGASLTDLLEEDPAVRNVNAFSRSGTTPYGGGLAAGRVDLAHESTVARAAATAGKNGPIHLVIVATGYMHDGAGEGPEMSWRDIDGGEMAHAYQVNVIGPSLVAKHFLPLMPREGKSVFAVLTEDIREFTERHPVGWYAYRASKIALNSVIDTLAGELAARRKDTACVGLFPGVVDTMMSQPFHRTTSFDSMSSPDEAAADLLRVIDAVEPSKSGRILDLKGKTIAV